MIGMFSWAALWALAVSVSAVTSAVVLVETLPPAVGIRAPENLQLGGPAIGVRNGSGRRS